MTVVYTGGTFDLFHDGHARFLRRCRQLAEMCGHGKVVASVNRDEFVERFKGRLPVDPLEKRMANVLALGFVDEVIVNTGDEDSKIAILKVMPRIVAIDTGWAMEDYYAQMSFTQEWLDANEIQLVYLPRTPGISTTQIRAEIGA